MIRRKAARRSSAQYFISAEDHVENEVKHERLLTETSRLSSSWAGLSVSGGEVPETDGSCSSSLPCTSPAHRPSSFSGPLVISVTCSSSSPGVHNSFSSHTSGNRCTPTSPSPHMNSSGYSSPIASPVSSRVQCYSPSVAVSASSPTLRRPVNGGASPLLVSAALCRKRNYLSCAVPGCGGSSDDASREGSPDPFQSSRGCKAMRQADTRSSLTTEISHFRWPPGLPLASDPPSPSCQLFPSSGSVNPPSSPSSSSLPSPHLSLASSVTTFPGSPASSTSNCFVARLSEPSVTTSSPSIEEKPTVLLMDVDTKTGSSVVLSSEPTTQRESGTDPSKDL
ncbi:hypothetical protein FBUS_07316 [Fasciolopsis buskii]|uniref:Uncharacterized protein n=1 Tax=Fasciolopsis buskii TaxID=27845 RepID=A0A8E0RM85_9TREM|nr:hypothetical protein FBUS_07316 [Fasciolopsis buski]